MRVRRLPALSGRRVHAVLLTGTDRAAGTCWSAVTATVTPRASFVDARCACRSGLRRSGWRAEAEMPIAGFDERAAPYAHCPGSDGPGDADDPGPAVIDDHRKTTD